jgi:hypothetical protein
MAETRSELTISFRAIQKPLKRLLQTKPSDWHVVAGRFPKD